HDPVYDIHSRGYIDDLIQVLILYELFKNAEDTMSMTKALAKMVLSGEGLDSKYPLLQFDKTRRYNAMSFSKSFEPSLSEEIEE
ncbi:3050_t:CDS:2, partial [Funneliformis mosseae]